MVRIFGILSLWLFPAFFFAESPTELQQRLEKFEAKLAASENLFLAPSAQPQISPKKKHYQANLEKELLKASGKTKIDILIKLADFALYHEGNIENLQKYGSHIIKLSNTQSYTRGRVFGYYYLGHYYFLKGQKKMAFRSFRETENLNRGHLSKGSLGHLYLILAPLSIQIETKISITIQYYHSAIHLFKNLEDTTYLTSSYINLGNFYLEYGDKKKAYQYYRKGYQIAIQSNNPTSTVSALRRLSKYYLSQKKFSLALDNLEEALRISLKKPNSYTLMWIVLATKEIYYGTGNFKKAHYYFNKHDALFRNYLGPPP